MREGKLRIDVTYILIQLYFFSCDSYYVLSILKNIIDVFVVNKNNGVLN